MPVPGDSGHRRAAAARRHKEAPSAEKAAWKRLQIFGNGSTEKLLTKGHIISLIFKQNSPLIFQNHIEHFRIIDFNGEFCPKINGAIQPKVNCFLVSIFFVRAVAMWKTIFKMCIFCFCLFPQISLNSALLRDQRGRAGCAGCAGGSAPQAGKDPPGSSGPGLGFFLKPRFQAGFPVEPRVRGLILNQGRKRHFFKKASVLLPGSQLQEDASCSPASSGQQIPAAFVIVLARLFLCFCLAQNLPAALYLNEFMTVQGKYTLSLNV